MEKESLLLFLVTALIIALIGLLTAVGVLIYLLTKKTRETAESTKEDLPVIKMEPVQEVKSMRDNAQGICQNHPDLMASGMCAICAGLFCEKCLKSYETLHFCLEHFEIFINGNWVEVETIKSTPHRPLDGLDLHIHKEKMWLEQAIPSYVMTHYKIEIESDQIETHIKLFARDKELHIMKRKLPQK